MLKSICWCIPAGFENVGPRIRIPRQKPCIWPAGNVWNPPIWTTSHQTLFWNNKNKTDQGVKWIEHELKGCSTVSKIWGGVEGGGGTKNFWKSFKTVYIPFTVRSIKPIKTYKNSVQSLHCSSLKTYKNVSKTYTKPFFLRATGALAPVASLSSSVENLYKHVKQYFCFCLRATCAIAPVASLSSSVENL